jgi:hypothetical protein
MLWVSPAWWASIARTARVEYGFFQDDSNRKVALLPRCVSIREGESFLDVAGNGT